MTLKPLKISYNEWGAILTWFVVFIVTIMTMNNASWQVRVNFYPVALCFFIYLICLISVFNESFKNKTSKRKAVIFVIQLLSAFSINYFVTGNFLPILTIIWASMLPFFVSIRNSFIITCCVVFSWYLFDWWLWEDDNIVYSGLLFFTFHLFSVSMTVNALNAENAKEKAEMLNKELESTQLLLGEASRQNERTRIARDLHDLLGHHLTALLINLQIAEHTSEGTTKENIGKCHSLAKLLMSDVRESVANIRDNRSLNFESMLNKMVDQVPRLKFHINLKYNFELDEIELAKQLLSCIQETITNCLKHSQASDFYLDISQNKQDLIVIISDNGNCSRNIEIGHGLSGLKERIDLLNGSFKYHSNNGSLELKIEIPIERI